MGDSSLAEQARIPEEAMLPAWAGLLWEAFWWLSTERHWSLMMVPLPMGGTITERIPERIPWSAIDRYACRAALPGSEWQAFLYLLGVLDEEYLMIQAERRKDSGGG